MNNIGLYKLVNAWDMKEDLIKCRRDFFSIEALEIYSDMINECGSPCEWDPIGFDCDWTELTVNEILDEYPEMYDYFDKTLSDDVDISKNDILEWLSERTIAFKTNKGFLYMNF